MRLLAPLPTPDFTREFVVDETPELLGDIGEDGRDDNPGAEADLMTLIGGAMLENERLGDLAHRLEQSVGGNQDEEAMRIVRTLLPVLDNFDRVCDAARGFETSEVLTNWLRSVESIHARLLQGLGGVGLEPLSPLGQKVDLERDEVVEYRPTEDHASDTVIEVRRRGYRFRGRCLRDAQVIVAQSNRSA